MSLELSTEMIQVDDQLRTEQWIRGTRNVSHVVVQSRRVKNSERGDEAQIELTVRYTNPNKPKHRWTGASSSLILTPRQARALALSICPELAT